MQYLVSRHQMQSAITKLDSVGYAYLSFEANNKMFTTYLLVQKTSWSEVYTSKVAKIPSRLNHKYITTS